MAAEKANTKQRRPTAGQTSGAEANEKKGIDQTGKESKSEVHPQTPNTKNQLKEAVRSNMVQFQENWIEAICTRLLENQSIRKNINESSEQVDRRLEVGSKSMGEADNRDTLSEVSSASTHSSTTTFCDEPRNVPRKHHREADIRDITPTERKPLLYQATVETEPEDESDNETPAASPQDSSFELPGYPFPHTKNALNPSPSSSPLSSPTASSASVHSSTQSRRSARETRMTPRQPSTSGSTSHKARPSVHFSARTPTVLQKESPPTPSATSKTEVTLSAVDLKWGELFTETEEPTARLVSVLRGLADHLITQFEPQDSMVIGPDKLDKYYSMFELTAEATPFQKLFDQSSKQSLELLEVFYQDIGCQYHLVQNRPNARPCVPALTPNGFVHWMITWMRAFPSHEAARMNEAVSRLPLEAKGMSSDLDKERLPRQLSRHLLPSKPHEASIECVIAAISTWKKCSGLSQSSSPQKHKRQQPILNYETGMTRGDALRRRVTEGDERAEVEVPQGRSSRSYMKQSKRYNHDSERERVPTRHYKRGSTDKSSRRDASPHEEAPRRRPRSPAPSKRYRHSMIDTTTGSSNGYSTPEYVDSSHGGSGQRRSRDEGYGLVQGRDPRSSAEQIPRTVIDDDDDAGRQIIMSGSGRTPIELMRSYDDYVPRSTKMSRTKSEGGSNRGG